MSFVSKGWSSESFDRGLELAHSASLDLGSDPEPAAVLAELERLQDGMGQRFCFCHSDL